VILAWFFFMPRVRRSRALMTMEQSRLLRALGEEFEREQTIPGHESKREELWNALIQSAARSRSQS
jgi:hypothetical protein